VEERHTAQVGRTWPRRGPDRARGKRRRPLAGRVCLPREGHRVVVRGVQGGRTPEGRPELRHRKPRREPVQGLLRRRARRAVLLVRRAAVTLVWPAREYLPGYVDALERGWSADNLRGDEAARE